MGRDKERNIESERNEGINGDSTNKENERILKVKTPALRDNEITRQTKENK